MLYKVGVTLPRKLDPRMFLAHAAVERAWSRVQAKAPGIPEEATITSWADSQHGPNSYHKKDGRAVDVRTKSLPRNLVPEFVADVKKRLTLLGFDVVMEDLDGQNEHLHIELDARADG